MSDPQARVPGSLGIAQAGERGSWFRPLQTARLAAVSASGGGDFAPCGNSDTANVALVAELQQALAATLPHVPALARGAILMSPAALPFLAGGVAARGYRFLREYRDGLRPIDIAHLPAIVTERFGSSIDFSTVWISDKTGAQNRPFTATVVINFPPGIARRINVMNLGTNYKDKTLVHELTHVWQSQHHPNSMQYMRSCIGCQAWAVYRNQDNAKISPSVIANRDFPQDYPFSAYAYETDKSVPFSHYGGEQIAQQVENNVEKIVKVVKAAAPNAVVSENVDSLQNMRSVANRLDKGVDLIVP